MHVKYIIPPKLNKGDEIRVIAPSRSLSIIGETVIQAADRKFEELGLNLSLGQYVYECDAFNSSSVESRIEDLHDAFRDTQVKAILTVIGGYNSNQLLRYIDWDIIRNNPKVFCGFSDITALGNAILAKTGLVTYSGPHYIMFARKTGFAYTLDHFMECTFGDSPICIKPSPRWSEWHRDPARIQPINNDGYWIINGGQAEGRIIGGNLCTLNLLQGTEYFPDLTDTILFLEDDAASNAPTFDRDLQSLIHQPSFAGVKGIVIGRFETVSKVTQSTMTDIIRNKKELNAIPVIGNVDFGHTDPQITFPIGGSAKLAVTRDTVEFVITEH